MKIFFLRLNDIHISLIHIIYFIHSSISEQLGCIHLLAIVNDDAMNMVRKYLFEILCSILLDIFLVLF